ncbi:hypothetical protein SAMN05421753_101253 [Planctomicrobium piriforme]|uniref:Uncharacterized protein n=1 Tax=Planctomicrobium piriforme TaxID=1576369 RepID=A0A1I3B5U6_9PLAN|nr:hypothetical protein SAMN05421753_101253 [Planctomicrobium piriforme]
MVWKSVYKVSRAISRWRPEPIVAKAAFLNQFAGIQGTEPILCPLRAVWSRLQCPIPIFARPDGQ